MSGNFCTSKETIADGMKETSRNTIPKSLRRWETSITILPILGIHAIRRQAQTGEASSHDPKHA